MIIHSSRGLSSLPKDPFLTNGRSKMVRRTNGSHTFRWRRCWPRRETDLTNRGCTRKDSSGTSLYSVGHACLRTGTQVGTSMRFGRQRNWLAIRLALICFCLRALPVNCFVFPVVSTSTIAQCTNEGFVLRFLTAALWFFRFPCWKIVRF